MLWWVVLDEPGWVFFIPPMPPGLVVPGIVLPPVPVPAPAPDPPAPPPDTWANAGVAMASEIASTLVARILIMLVLRIPGRFDRRLVIQE